MALISAKFDLDNSTVDSENGVNTFARLKSFTGLYPAEWFAAGTPTSHRRLTCVDLYASGLVDYEVTDPFLEEFKPHFRLVLEQSGRTVELDGIGGGPVDPYQWTPDNSAEVIAFLKAITVRAGTQNPSPVIAFTIQTDVLTDAEVAEAIRADLSDAARLRKAAVAVVERYAPDAPPAVSNEAVVRLAGYMLDAPPAGAGESHAAALRNSGAAGLLSPWRVRRAGTIG